MLSNALFAAYSAAMPMIHDPDLHQARREAILYLLRTRQVASQDELVELLAERGIEATQSSVSRDLRYMGVGKVAGRYLPPGGERGSGEDLLSAARFARRARPAGPHLAVVQTTVGAAQTVAQALDRAGWPEVMGTLAGDDTIFVATANARDQARFLDRLGLLLASSPEPTS